jgi:molybdopterin/thiamine biosynthesis adenylyltransferase
MSESDPRAQGSAAKPNWAYEEAFSRHLGLIDPQEQQRLRASRVAIAGTGGVGGVHLATLARLGIGAFHIADPDSFEVANFNRQYGATIPTLGRNKAEVMAEVATSINPELDVQVFPEAITPANVGRFLDGVDVYVDGLDAFVMPARRLVFREARQRGIWSVTAGPLGFSTMWLTFSPTGMSFDEYFDLNDSMTPMDQLIAFVVGITPRATHRPYMDVRYIDPRTHRGPSAALACHLCSGVAAAEVLKILLGRSPVRPVPWYFQFDAYRQVLRKGYLRWGNRHPLQRVKRWLFRKYAIRQGWDQGSDLAVTPSPMEENTSSPSQAGR